jgi:drug/metabolite transporter (DMT)-like permease
MKAIIFAVAAGLCWGAGEVATRAVLHSKQVGPFGAIAVRSTVALPLILVAYVVAAHVLRSPAEPTGWASNATTAAWLKLVLGSGVVAGAAAMICFYAALSMGEISRIKPIAFALAPATGVVLGWLLLGESMNGRKLLAIGLILAGVVLLTFNPGAKAGGG